MVWQPHTEKWSVSPYNFAPQVRDQMSLPSRVVLNDLTLREGRQMEGVMLRVDEVERIAAILAELGVPMIQMHYFPEELRAVSQLRLPIKVEVLISSPYQRWPFTRDWHRTAMQTVSDCGMELDLIFGLSEEVQMGSAELRGVTARPEELRESELELALESIAYGKKLGAVTAVNLQDFTRVDLDYLLRFCRALGEAGVDRITLDDIAAPAIPNAYRFLLHQVKVVVPTVPIGVHVMDDFGTAAAVLLGAYEGGAEVLDVGVNGYGERAGHASLAEVAVILEVFYSMSTGIRLERLRDTAILIADIMKADLPPRTPLVGDNAFADTSDWHFKFAGRPWAAGSIAEELVGQRRRIALGERSGPLAVRARAEELGLALTEEQAERALETVSQEIRRRKRPLKDQELRRILIDSSGSP